MSTEIQKHIDTVLAELRTTEIRSTEEYEAAGAFLRKCKESTKFVQDAFGDELKAAQEKKRQAEAERKEIDAKIRQFTTPLSDAERSVKVAIVRWTTEQERIRREEIEANRRAEQERRLAEAIESGKDEILDKPVIVKAETQAPPKIDGTYFVETWKWEIEDIAKINPDYLLADEVKIRKVVGALKADAAKLVGGIRVWSEKETRVRL
jgi:hypothetical protein